MTSTLVVRVRGSWRRALLWIAVILLVPVALYVSFDLGRNRAGFDSAAAARERGALQEQLRELKRQLHEQSVQLAAAEAASLGQNRERAELARSIGELQAQVARQSQDLAFFHGIVGDSAQLPPVKIQQFRVVEDHDGRHFVLKLVLSRPVQPEDVISGALSLTVEGSQSGQPVNVDLAQITDEHRREITFNYRYLQSFDIRVQLPVGLRPERVTVEVRPMHKGAAPFRQSFLWHPESV